MSPLGSTVIIVISLMMVTSTSGITTSDYDFEDYTDHPCVRTCENGAPPRTCKYKWLLENYFVLSMACWKCPANQSDCFLPHCVPANGVLRSIKTANRKMPGPPIRVCRGDKVQVTIDNRMEGSEGTTIHWHGLLMRNTPFMDGVAMVTQCPIPSMTTFTYSFNADEAGTHFWHAHAGVQRADGLFGSLVVQSPPDLEPSYDLYDFDLPEHTIVVSDWKKDSAVDWFSSLSHHRGTYKAGYMLINGLGPDFSDVTPQTPRAEFKVKAGHKYRFRVINAGIFDCGMQISIDDHNLTIIASDGNSVEPLEVESFNLFAGERFDFVLDTNTTDAPKKHWIRLRGIGACGTQKLSQTAILDYEGSVGELPDGNTTYEDSYREGVNLNTYEYPSQDELQLTSLRSTDPDEDLVKDTPDRKIFVEMDFNMINNNRMNQPNLYSIESVPSHYQKAVTQLNHISNTFPSSPPLTQMKDIPKSDFCNADTVQKNCVREYCECVHHYQIAVGDLVELIVVAASTLFPAQHPMHIHGYKYRVVGMEKLGTKTTIGKIKALDSQGRLQRNITAAPLKDTVITPDGGYVILRFRADNPGVWFFHCHLKEHNAMGMGLLLQVGNDTEMPRVPKGFPRCGPWHFHGYDDSNDGDGDGEGDGDNSKNDTDDKTKCDITLNLNNSSPSSMKSSSVSHWLGLVVIASVVILRNSGVVLNP